MNAEPRVHVPMPVEAHSQSDSAWEQIHRDLKAVVRQRGAGEYEEARLIREAFRCHVHLMLGFASFGEYLDRHVGYSGRAGAERLRVAQALETLPLIAAALRDGELCWSAVRELTRVAIPSTEAEWLADARSRSVRFVEQRVAGLSPGDRPGAVPPPGARPCVLRFEVTTDTMALFREAQAHIRAESGGGLDDNGVLSLMVRAVLGGPRDDGRASYQIAVIRCPECKQARMLAAGEAVPINATAQAMVECDATIVPVDDWADAGSRDEVSLSDRPAARVAGGDVAGDKKIPPRFEHSMHRLDSGDVAGDKEIPPRFEHSMHRLDGGDVAGDKEIPPRFEHSTHRLDGGRPLGAEISPRVAGPTDRPWSVRGSHPEHPARSPLAHVGLEDGARYPVVPQAGLPAGVSAPPGAPRPLEPGPATHARPDGEGRRTRATQTIPPAIRRHVLLRDERRCVVPGCRFSRYLDVHHLILRSEGGKHGRSSSGEMSPPLEGSQTCKSA